MQALADAYTRERNPRVKKRIEFVLDRGDRLPVGETATVERVSRNTPTHWVRRFNAEGLRGLHDRPRRGRVPKLPHDRIDQVLSLPPRAAGFRQEAWTPKLLWHALRNRHGVSYSKGHLSYLTKKLGYRRIVPRTQGVNADPDAQVVWRFTEGNTLLRDHADHLWVEDETTARVGTIVKKVLARRGSKPVVRVKVGTYAQKVNVFISWRAKTNQVVVSLEDSLDSVPTKRHLSKLKRVHGKGPLHLLWDGTGSHRDAGVRHFSAKAGIHFHRFPTHSPKMNPVEQINKELKVFLALTLFDDREELVAEIRHFFREHRYKFAFNLAAFI